MIVRRLRLLFARYATEHVRLSAPPRPILDREGTQIGYVDALDLEQGRLRIAGWVHAAQVTLLVAGGRVSTRPGLFREDVAKATGGPAAVGFALSLPCSWDTLQDSDVPGLLIETAAPAPAVDPMSLTGLDQRQVRLRLIAGFALALVRALPALAGWAITRSPRYRARIKRRLGLSQLNLASQEIDAGLLAAAGPAAPPAGATSFPEVTIVLPVFNAFDLLGEVLDRVCRHSDLGVRLILIEDCSSDPQVRPFLRDWTGRMNDPATRPSALLSVTLLENDSNLGFIASTNRGMAEALGPSGGTGPVVLLNSDALVPQDWTSRLVAPLVDPTIASVTPMSNDAEILTVPVLCVPTALKPGQGDALDAVAQTMTPGAGLTDLPTGVGFCMALDRAWLKRAPAFDTAFGRGYGEEVDWCQKLRALGARHVGLPQLFVEHRGGSSFGSDEKLARIQANNALVARRYPGFDAEVQRFIASDPLATGRLLLAIAWAGGVAEAAGAAMPVYLAHSLGGGAEFYLDARIREDLDRVGAAIVLRVGGEQRWQIELVSPGGRVSGRTDATDVVSRLLASLPRRTLIYSCGVGDPDPIELPQLLAGLKRPQDAVEILFHDFFPLSPSYTLLGSDGAFHGTPVARRRPGTGADGADIAAGDPAHSFQRAGGERLSLADWQAAWHRLASEARELRVFSPDSAGHVAAVWPDLSDRIRVMPHRLTHQPAPMTPPSAGRPPVIGVLGNIGRQKGAEILVGLARQLDKDRTGQTGLVLVGTIDPTYDLPSSVPVTGSYQLESLSDLARHHRISHWLIPSIWPETFSYTTHEALATGLPVMAFALGAQGAAVASAPNGVVLSLDEEPVAAILRAVQKSTLKESA